MVETPCSLLERIRGTGDSSAWTRLVDVYDPMIRGWLRRHDVPRTDMDDIVQEIMGVVVKRVEDFDRQRTGSFRSWLRNVTVNCLRDHWKAARRRPKATGDTGFGQMLTQLQDPDSGLSRLWDEQHDQHVMQFLLQMIKPEFKESTWIAFQRLALEGVPAEEVAAELKITVNAAYIARSRVLRRLREEGKGLID